MKKRIKIISVFVLICSLCIGCARQDSDSEKKQGEEKVESQTENNKEQSAEVIYEVDYLKISPMVRENVGDEVVDGAIAVIEAFLNYENSATVVISGNTHRFLNDMGYVINSACPMFAAFTDYNEMTSYDDEKEMVTWEFLITRDEFQKKVDEFSKIVNEYLAQIDEEDSDAMKAILLYYKLLQNGSYDYEILGDAYETMDKAQYALRNSSYNVFVNKTGICTNLSQALMFLYTQVDLTSGTVLHQGGTGSHMWVIVKVDDCYYYCDPTWDVGESLRTFGITSDDRSSWAGEYTKEGGTMLNTVIEQKYKIDDNRFEILRQKVPVEITNVRVDKQKQTITFEGYEYEYTFDCTDKK